MAPWPSRGHASLRNGAGGVQPSAAEGPLATTCDEWTGNDDFIAAGLSPERDDDDRDPFDVFADASGGGGSQPPVNDVDPVDAGTGTAVDSNTHTISTGVNGNVMVMLLLPLVHVVSDGLSVGKHLMRFLR